MLWVSRSVASLLVRGAGFHRRPLNVGFVMDTVALGQVLHPVLILSVAIIPPMLSTHSLIHHRRNIMLAVGGIVKQECERRVLRGIVELWARELGSAAW